MGIEFDWKWYIYRINGSWSWVRVLRRCICE